MTELGKQVGSYHGNSQGNIHRINVNHLYWSVNAGAVLYEWTKIVKLILTSFLPLTKGRRVEITQPAIYQWVWSVRAWPQQELLN